MDKISEIKNIIDFNYLLNRMGIEVNSGGFIKSIYKEERTPSLKINFNENYFKCFATGNGGDVISFYQDYYNVDTGTAIKELADIAGISNDPAVQREKASVERKISFRQWLSKRLLEDLSEDESYGFFERLGIMNVDLDKEVAADHAVGAFKSIFINAIQPIKMNRIIENSKVFEELISYCKFHQSDDALRYLVEERKLSFNVLRAFKIVTFDNYFQVNNHMKKEFELKVLQRSGLFNDKGNMVFYHHHILLPYLYNGKAVYVRGRYYKDGSAKTDEIKYLGVRNDAVDVNTPKRFFNIDVLNSMQPGERIYIVEGEFDVVALSGLSPTYNVIGVPGVGNLPSRAMLDRLLPFEIIICVDNDEAGKGLMNELTKYYHSKDKEVIQKTIDTKDINEFVAA
jgi:DNA primase